MYIYIYVSMFAQNNSAGMSKIGNANPPTATSIPLGGTAVQKAHLRGVFWFSIRPKQKEK